MRSIPATDSPSSTELRRRLVLVPDDASASIECACRALAAGEGDTVALWLGAAAAVAPTRRDLAPLLAVLARSYLAVGLASPAARTFRRAVAADPGDWGLWNDRGVASDRAGDRTGAAAAFRSAVAIEPAAVSALSNLADLLYRAGEFSAADCLAGRAIGDADALATLGNARLRLGSVAPAARAFRRAMALSPTSVVSLAGLGTVFMTDENVEWAGILWRRAAAVRPDDVATNNNLATWHLTQGDLRHGFELYEWRWRRPEAEPRRQGLPEWDGSTITGRRILLYAEQGLGDALQMARYVPEIAARGAIVELECARASRRLYGSLPGVSRIVAPGEPAGAEVQASLMSLPRLLGTTLESIPGRVPYLAADADLERAVAPLFGDRRPRVGLVWQGNPRQVDEPRRSVPLAALRPAIASSDAVFYGLQRDHGREQMSVLDGLPNFVDLGPHLDDLATTAALMTHLDLIISPCTAMAHLAGALGRPVWILLKRGPDWRWMLERRDSPWYPTATLIRQPRAGDWMTVAQQVAEMLQAWARPQ